MQNIDRHRGSDSGDIVLQSQNITEISRLFFEKKIILLVNLNLGIKEQINRFKTCYDAVFFLIPLVFDALTNFVKSADSVKRG